MAYVKGQPFIPQFTDPATGLLMTSGTIEFYLTGTSTPTPYYTDSAGTSGGTSLTLDSGGQPSTDIYFDTGITYKLVVKNAAGTTLRTIDPFSVIDSSNKPSILTNVAAIQSSDLTGVLQVKTLGYSAAGDGGAGNYRADTADTTTADDGFLCIVSNDGVRFKLQTSKKIDVIMAGALGDGSDQASKIQAVIDKLGGDGGGDVVLTAGGDFRVSVTKGTNDKWGLNLKYSNVNLILEDGATLRRFDPDISTYAKAFPIVLIGVPDSNLLGDQIKNVKIKGGEYIGEDTRHAISGSAIMDGRQAIWIKNAKRVRIFTSFDDIDSSAIYVQRPGMYDYENSAYYNTTKCYNILISKSDFIANSHATAGRALLHAIVADADTVKVIDNYFEWCDDALSCSTTYDNYDDKETDTFTDSNLGQSVKRTGRGYIIKGNTFYNCSEHALYLEAMNIAASGNTVIVDDATTCSSYQYQIRGRGVTCSGEMMTGVHRAVSINTGSMDVSFSGTVSAVGDSAGGVINIQSQGLTTYIDNRSDYFQSYKPMENIRIDAIINLPEAAQTNGVGLRLYSDTTDSNFPDGQMINVNCTGTVINNAKKAILNVAGMAKNVIFNNMILNGKPFTLSGYGSKGTHDGASNAAVLSDSTQSWTVDAYIGWRVKNLTDGSEATVTANSATTITGALSGGTENDWDTSDEWQLVPTQNSLCALAVDDALTSALQEVTFKNNTVRGYQHVIYDDGGAGSAGTMFPPYGISGNTLNYIEYWDTEAFRTPSFESRFVDNQGSYFLDRSGWFSNTAINNSLSDGTTDSEKKSCIQLVTSSDVRIYHDDAGNYKAL